MGTTECRYEHEPENPLHTVVLSRWPPTRQEVTIKQIRDKVGEDPVTDYFERRRDSVIEAKRLQRRIKAFGFAVTITETAA